MPVPEAIADEVQVEPREVLEQLERLLASSVFRSSKRNSRFLRFVVEMTVAGKSSEIKERVIGAEVFDRPLDYDVSSDPIVRVAAGDLRKRVAKYYVDFGHEGELRLELPLGSYVPTFMYGRFRTGGHTTAKEHPILGDSVVPERSCETTVAPEESIKPGLRLRSGSAEKLAMGVAVVICAVSLAATWLVRVHEGPQRALDSLWHPILRSSGPVLVCAGNHNPRLHTPEVENGDLLENLLSTREHDPNDAFALMRLSSFLGWRQRSFSMIVADHVILTDLRSQPTIYVGGLNNPWTQRLLAGARFQMKLDSTTHFASITDSRNPNNRSWTVNMHAPIDSVLRDFALVSRIQDPKTGQPGLVVAGLGATGTAAATEFVITPTYFYQFARQAPKGWQDHDFQIVISTDLVDGKSGEPHMLMYDVQ